MTRNGGEYPQFRRSLVEKEARLGDIPRSCNRYITTSGVGEMRKLSGFPQVLSGHELAIISPAFEPWAGTVFALILFRQFPLAIGTKI
jgi:hypothetical protein